MKQAIHLLRLYRLDVAVISFFSFLLGRILVEKSYDLLYIILALCVSLISVNFVYAINAWFDREIDALNKPHRPLPSGKISGRSVKVYLVCLLAASLVYPFLLLGDHRLTGLLFWFLPVLGIAYSNPWYPLKKKIFSSSILTSLVLVYPMFLGVMISQKPDPESMKIISFFFLYALTTVPLKDIEDVKGDIAFKSQNWAHILGIRKLILLSASLHILLAFITLFLIHSPLKYWLFAGAALSFATQMWFIAFRLPLHRLYRTLILLLIAEASLFYLLNLYTL